MRAVTATTSLIPNFLNFSSAEESSYEISWKDEALQRQYDKQSLYHRWKIFDKEQDDFMRTEIGILLFGQVELPNENDPPTLNHYYKRYSDSQQKTIQTIVEKIRYKIPLPGKVAFGWIFLTARVDGCKDIQEFVVFRCATGTLSDVFFIEPTGRVYQNWRDFVDSNKLPPCTYLAPDDGIYKLEGAIRVYTSPEANKNPVERHVDKMMTVAGVGIIGAGIFSIAPVTVAVAGKESVILFESIRTPFFICLFLGVLF